MIFDVLHAGVLATRGEDVLYDWQGDFLTIQGVFTDAAEIVTGDADIVSSNPEVFIRLSDLPSGVVSRNTDSLKIRGVWYDVYDVRKDGEGAANLDLKKKPGMTKVFADQFDASASSKSYVFDLLGGDSPILLSGDTITAAAVAVGSVGAALGVSVDAVTNPVARINSNTAVEFWPLVDDGSLSEWDGEGKRIAFILNYTLSTGVVDEITAYIWIKQT